jgi:hypothetical protein
VTLAVEGDVGGADLHVVLVGEGKVPGEDQLDGRLLPLFPLKKCVTFIR